MSRRGIDRLMHPSLAAALAAVLLLLAWLQYRWIGEISEADRARLENSLTVATMQFRLDFNRQLATTAIDFIPSPDDVVDRDWSRIGGAYERLVSRSADTLPIRDVYLWEDFADAKARLLRLNPDTLKLEEAEWPPELAASRPPARDLRPRRGPGSPGGGGPRSFGWTFLEQGPALAIPLFERSEEPGTNRGRFEPVGQLYIELDQSQLVEHVLPELEQRYFELGVERPYQVGIESGDRLIYKSDASLTAGDFQSADIRMPLLLSFEEIASRFSEMRRGPQPGDGEGSGGPGGPPPDEDFGRGFRERPPREPGPQPGNDRGGFNPTRSRDFARGRPFVAFGGPGGDSWMLVARHREGSLDSVVSRLRRRNLGISFGILLLLAAGMGFALISARRAQRLARLQLDFVAGVSHELRTPLAVIRQAGDNLAEGVVAAPESVREYGRLIRDEGRRLTGMVEHSLDFAKSQSGKREYRIEAVPLKEMLDEALDEARPTIAEAGVELELNVPDRLPSVQADRAAVTQCLRNLIANAVKYGGTARRLGVRASQEPGGAVVEVQDHGFGIAAEDLPYIFDPFYRGKQAKDAQIQGSGLGLSLARDAARAAGGDLTVVSRLGEGSVFKLWLPTANGSGERRETAEG